MKMAETAGVGARSAIYDKDIPSRSEAEWTKDTKVMHPRLTGLPPRGIVSCLGRRSRDREPAKGSTGTIHARPPGRTSPQGRELTPMTRVGVLKLAGRVAALALLLVAMAGPWTFDIHSDQEEACPAPLVWLGDGRCACTPSLWTLIGVSLKWGNDGLFSLLLLPRLPFLSTMLLLVLDGQHRWPWVLHLTAWGLAFALFDSRRGRVLARARGDKPEAVGHLARGRGRACGPCG